MKPFNHFWLKPKHQLKGKPEVEFELRPLDQRAFLSLKNELFVRKGKVSITADGLLECFTYGVTNWKGLELEFSSESKREIADGVANWDWGQWMEEIAGTLYRRCILGEPEAKNS